MNIPPHLPPKDSPLIPWNRMRFWVWFSLGIVSAFLAGVAGTLSTIAWFAPTPSPVPTVYTLRKERSPLVTTAYLDPLVLQQVEQRIVGIYDKRKKVQGAHYTADAKVGEAVLLTREGWAVFPTESFVSGEEKNFDVVDFQGNVFGTSLAVFDPVSNLTYIKLIGSGFRGDAVFPDWNDVDVDTRVLSIFGSTVQEGYIEGVGVKAKTSFPLWEANEEYAVSASLPVHSVLISERGELVGFVGALHTLIPAWYIPAHLRSLFEQEKIVYESLPYKGQEIISVVNNGRFEEQSGFLVTESPTKVTSSTIGVGDIIVRVDSELYDPIATSRTLLGNTAATIKLTVLRGTQSLEMNVAKTVVHVDKRVK